MDGIGGTPSVGAGHSGGLQGPSQNLDQLIQQTLDQIQASAAKVPAPAAPKGVEGLRVQEVPRARTVVRASKNCSKNWSN